MGEAARIPFRAPKERPTTQDITELQRHRQALGLSKMALLEQIRNLSRLEGAAYCGQRHYGRQLGISSRHVRRILTELIALGLVTYDGPRGIPKKASLTPAGMAVFGERPEGAELETSGLRTSMSAPCGHKGPPRSGHSCPPNLSLKRVRGRRHAAAPMPPPAPQQQLTFSDQSRPMFVQQLRGRSDLDGRMEDTFARRVWSWVTWDDRARRVSGCTCVMPSGVELRFPRPDGTAEAVHVPTARLPALELWAEAPKGRSQWE